jgi:acetyltransferase
MLSGALEEKGMGEEERSAQATAPQHGSLDAFFAPRSVAVIGATEAADSVGRTILWNLIGNPFGGTVYPVNPRRASILGIKAYPHITSVAEPVDLAVVVTPAPAVPQVVGECIAAGVKGAIVISAGFREIGPAGHDLERQVQEELGRGRMRLIGPNCLGVMCPGSGLNASCARAMARPGTVAFVSQSGALCTAILDWSLRENVGFSAFLSIGSMLDVGWGDLIDYLGDDPHTRSIILYMESVGNARAFLSAAREVAWRKPIIVIKAGRTEAAASAAASHTGALTGSDEVLDAAFRRCGVLRVDRISDVFYMADVLAKQPRPRGPRLTIVTNAGGPGVLAVDSLLANGGELARLSPETKEELNHCLPAHWSHNNPIDILGDAGPERYARTLEIAARNPGSDGLLVILTPQATTDPTQTAEHLKPYARTAGKPVLASWMGAAEVAAGDAILSRAGIPVFPFPDTATQVFTFMWQYIYNLRGLYEIPVFPSDAAGSPDRIRADEIIQSARRTGRSLLTEPESKNLLAAYGIPAVATRAAATEDEAVRLAGAIGYPVVLKLLSHTITHKTDVGGVHLQVPDADAVRRAYRAIESSVRARAGAEHFQGVTVQPMSAADGYELIVGSSIDPQIGPVLMFGAGGALVEVFKDRALALPPLNTTLARRLLEQTRIYAALKGVRGRPPVDLAALEQLLVGFSQLVVEQPWIKEIDINPVLASPAGVLALDARVVVHGLETKEESLPRPAIRPYPIQYVSSWTMKDGTPVTIRPIRPEDEPLVVDFHKTLSEQTVYFRYFQALKLSQRVTHERLARLCFIDYDREIALVAERLAPTTQAREILGIGRLIKLPGSGTAEFAVIVSDRCQRQGLGSELVRQLIQIGRAEKLTRITADILRENRGMLQMCARLGFQTRVTPGDLQGCAEMTL